MGKPSSLVPASTPLSPNHYSHVPVCNIIFILGALCMTLLSPWLHLEDQRTGTDMRSHKNLYETQWQIMVTDRSTDLCMLTCSCVCKRNTHTHTHRWGSSCFRNVHQQKVWQKIFITTSPNHGNKQWQSRAVQPKTLKGSPSLTGVSQITGSLEESRSIQGCLYSA